MSVLSQDHYAFDEFPVLDTVMMGNKKLYEIKNEMDAIYAKEDFSEEDIFDNELIEIEDKSLSFWLNDDVLDEIQWTPFFIDEDTLDWPK